MQNGKFKVNVVALANNRQEAEELRTKYINRRRRVKNTLNKRVGLAGRYPQDPEQYAIVRISNKDWVYFGATSDLKSYYNSIDQQVTNENVAQSSFARPMRTFGYEDLGKSYVREQNRVTKALARAR